MSWTNLDFARQGLGGTHRVGWLLAAVGVAWAAWQGWGAYELRTRVQAERQNMSALFAPAKGARAGTGSTATMTAEDRRRHAQLDAVAGYLAAPWEDLMAVFEQSRPGITLKRLEPDAGSGMVRLTGEATDTKAMAAYLISLETQSGLGQVVLLHHERLKDVPGTPLEFSLTAAWKDRLSAAAATLTASSPAWAASTPPTPPTSTETPRP